MAIIGWQKPNLLLLDEPTNHLDLDMRLALTMALQSFEGAMILVSHDRNLIRSTTDELFLVHDGTMESYAGDLDDYSLWLTQLRSKERNDAGSEGSKDVPSQQKKEQRRQEALRREALRPLKQKADQLERQLETLQNSLATVDEQLSDAAIYEEVAKDQLKQCLGEQTALKRQIADVEEAWMEALEALEEAQGSGV